MFVTFIIIHKLFLDDVFEQKKVHKNLENLRLIIIIINIY